MHKIQTLVFIGCISFTGFAALAQQPGTPITTDDMMGQLLSGSAGAGVTDVAAALSAPPETGITEEAVSTIEGPLVIEVATPEVNVSTVEAVDSLTQRYPPRLKINFSEFPLRSLESAKRAQNGRNAKMLTEIVAQRIQTRLHLPQLELVVKDRTATISGTVETERQRDLVARMLRFEPGIDAVQNELTVVPSVKD